MSQIEQKTADTNDGVVTYRELGSGTPLVLLHGIGSGSESWRAQLLDFGKLYHVIAWDAPGYGGSTPVAPSTPSAADYARRLETFLDALGVATCHLVGHSLGAIMACRFARDKSERVKSLMLASPAMGYGSQGKEIQNERRTGRIELLETLGPKGLARERHANLLSAAAPKWARDRASAGHGPTHIEVYTYRAGAHSSSDDPSAYRPGNEFECWPGGDPVQRLRDHLMAIGEWDEKKHFPVDVIKQSAELGFGAIYVSEESGGIGLGRLEAALIMEAMA